MEFKSFKQYHFTTTPLHVAVSCGDTRIMEYFIELGADLNVTTRDPYDVNTLALPKVAPLHIAVRKGVSLISHVFFSKWGG